MTSIMIQVMPMRQARFAFLLLLAQIAFSTQVFAQDFDWLRNLSVEARADPSGFVARLSTRFHIGDAQVRAVISNIGSQADAYMVLRLAEMSHKPVTLVSEQYHRYRHQGWGVIAKRLGIRPGSRAFHSLKAGHDLGFAGTGKSKRHGHGQGHGRGNDHGKHGGKWN